MDGTNCSWYQLQLVPTWMAYICLLDGRQPSINFELQELQDHPDATMNDHSRNLLNSVNHLPCKGRFKYYKKNSFAYIQISDDFSIIPTKHLDHLGYQQIPLMAKENSPRTHISALTHVEQRRTSKRKLKQVWNKWKGKNIDFRIVGVNQWYHTSK